MWEGVHFLTSLFSKPEHPLPLPPGPDTAAAEAARVARENDAITSAKASGRRQTMVGGMVIAEDQQQKKAQKLGAASQLTGI
jgi:hypothetical protein